MSNGKNSCFVLFLYSAVTFVFGKKGNGKRMKSRKVLFRSLHLAYMDQCRKEENLFSFPCTCMC
jgi:hypothetical protein